MKNIILKLLIFYTTFCLFNNVIAKTYSVEKVLDTNTLWSMTFINNNEALATTYKNNTIKLIDFKTNKIIKAFVIDINLETKSQAGMYDIVLHPNFKDNNYIYFTFALKKNNLSALALARATFINNNISNVEIIYEAPFRRKTKHYAGAISFNDRNQIFISVGERGEREDAQDSNNAIGATILLNDDGSIAENNPFNNEVYSLGHRNSQGLYFDIDTKILWQNEQGPKGGDELNIIKKGLNYGWAIVTKGSEYSGLALGVDEKEGYENPLIDWTPSLAVSSLTMYKGNKYPELKNHLLVSSLAARKLIAIEIKGEKIIKQNIILNNDIGRIRAVKVSPTGDIYLLADINNGVFLLK